ncbi:MAG: hypothetical protein JJU11_17600 [Candidatus Sumerlaeia bacterium]|nr:hypothetical protein [Candidatus Sumerlaeia bacterium]
MFKHLLKMHAPPGSGSGESEDDYLNRLAKSILSKPKAPPPGQQSGSGETRRPPTQIPPARPATRSDAPANGGNDSRTESSAEESSGKNRRPMAPTHQASSHDWVRSVDFYDAAGRFIPGTILVFEDGSMGIYRSFNADKDYDIVYQLQKNGTAKPHGMPLYAYEVEPVGRVSQACIEQVVKTGEWERDMIVFHLLKYRDRVHIPVIDEDAPEENDTVNSSDNVSRISVSKLPPEQLAPDAPEVHDPPKEDKPALVRGRRVSINFGGNQAWEAIYWGKDELGHVVVHNTHDKWSLMHLDLDRFKDTMVFGSMATPEDIARMEKDFATP